MMGYFSESDMKIFNNNGDVTQAQVDKAKKQLDSK